jgi:hypothetical protein
MLEKWIGNGSMNLNTSLRASLDQAHAALEAGDADEAALRAKAVLALARAEREVAELKSALTFPQEEDEEAIRAELRSRIRRLVDAQESGAADDELERIASGAIAP